MSAAELFFSVALRDGKWEIEATWPEDSTELVETFDDYFVRLTRRPARKNGKCSSPTSPIDTVVDIAGL